MRSYAHVCARTLWGKYFLNSLICPELHLNYFQKVLKVTKQTIDIAQESKTYWESVTLKLYINKLV